MVALLVSSVFAVWSWFRPYAWTVDPAARCKVVGTQVTKDRSNYWVDVHLKMTPGQTHDLLKPVRLRNAAGREIEAADTTLAGDKEGGTTDLWFKFWLETGDMEGPLTLGINEGRLLVKANTGIPELGRSNQEHFLTNNW